MKRIFSLLLFVFAFVLTACATTTSTLQQLPPEGSNLVMILVTAAVSWAILQLGALFKVDFSGYIGVIAAALAPIVVTLVESYLQLIPPAFDNIVLTVIHLIVLAVGSLGTFWVFQRKPAPSLK